MNIKQKYLTLLKELISKALLNLGIDENNPAAELPPNRELGDAAFPLFKYAAILKMKPFEIAQKIKSEIENHNIIEKTEVKGAYLNIFFNKKLIAGEIIKEILTQNNNFGKQQNKNQKVLVEFSCPNTNKPLHLGHCRNNVLGDAVSRLYSWNGYDVKKLNLINDRGIHICKSMLAYKLFGNSTTPEKENKKSDHFVGDYYVKYAKEADQNKNMEADAQKMLVLWEEKDPETLLLWEKMNKWAIDGILETYKRMGISFDIFEYEHITYLYGKEVIQEGLAKNIFYKEADGSTWVNNEDIGLDKKALLRGDGTSIYITQDIGTAVNRHKQYGFDKLIYVVASEQNYHFKTLFAILKKLGYQWAESCYHLSYGMVNLPDGRMKSREGNVVDADNLMDLLFSMAKEVMTEKKSELDENEKDEIAREISLAAMKYYLLNFSTIKDITFSPEKSISFDGNTGPYLQYTTARIHSLLKKAKAIQIDPEEIKMDNLNTDEWNVAAHLLDFEDTVVKASDTLSPIDLCNYLYNLAKFYNKFYHDNPVLSAEEEATRKARIYLSRATLTVMSIGLNLLGIKPLEKM